ncbi:MAG: leucine-rich repeat domain-containing protein, partial [Christensenellales bacterium]
YGCSNLTSITIGTGVKTIHREAFNYCEALTDIIYKGTTEQWKAIGKIFEWDKNTGDYTIHCTDGDISK